MNQAEGDKVLSSMVKFIESHGENRAAAIRKKADEEFTVGKSHCNVC
jgi:hypothetical protein